MSTTSAPQRDSLPRATARLQLHRDFTLTQACELVDYYATLGISHLYLSPILTARPGSTHGYDVVDATGINPELGGEKPLRKLCALLHERGMGLIVDIVPNHMATGHHNLWWQDVLRWGRGSRYAEWFDINWEAADPALRGKVLLPFLGQPYAQALQAGDINLCFDEQHGQFYFAHYEHRFPLRPQDYAELLITAGSERLQPAIDIFSASDLAGANAEQQAASGWQLLRELAQDEEGMADIDAALGAFSANQPHGAEVLHALLERQHYRLSCWRNAADEINWRRFFEVSELVGMRVENEEVFEALHAEIFRLYADGLIDGLRIDHIDGLADPGAYARRLRQRLKGLRADHEPYLIAEKILGRGESMPVEWQLDGTTGYEFMDQVAALLHDPEGKPVLDEAWRSVCGHGAAATLSQELNRGGERANAQPAAAHFSDPAAVGSSVYIADGCDLSDFEQIVRSARRDLLARNFAAEFNTLVMTLHQLARATLATRDMSLMSIRRALAELLVHFPVYRTYGTAEGMPAAERETLACAGIAASATLHAADHASLHVLEGWLGADMLSGHNDELRRGLQLQAITRFQQLTPPLTAKSVEDTAFYRYGRLLSRNEVGSDPAQLSISVQQFHQLAQQRLHEIPHTLLTTATHDHKRGEDARMRLAALSEIPEEWRTMLQHWRQLNAGVVQATAGEHGAIDGADECMLYQSLIGAWPEGMKADNENLMPLQQLAQRMVQWQRKALREAKRRSDWVAPQLPYEQACERFTEALLCDPGVDAHHHPFLLELQKFVERLAPLGAINSLTQCMLRMCTPGVPDLYQGGELWDFSLVDPDNRRPVDFALRARSLDNASQRPVSLRDWQPGASKLQLIRAVLAYRRGHADLFARGEYLPLQVQGQRAAHVIAFARLHEGQAVLVICTRLSGRLLALDASGTDCLPLVSAETWGDTCIVLPPELRTLRGQGDDLKWRSVLTSGNGSLGQLDLAGEEQHCHIRIGEILGSLPVELLELH
jgi:(1->4)-alpha-D-glucan 1-alpha-D-glucosylmutase